VALVLPGLKLPVDDTTLLNSSLLPVSEPMGDCGTSDNLLGLTPPLSTGNVAWPLLTTLVVLLLTKGNQDWLGGSVALVDGCLGFSTTLNHYHQNVGKQCKKLYLLK